MKKLRIVFAVFAVVAAGSLSAQSLSDVQAKYTQAVEAINSKDFNSAITLFEQVIDEGIDIEGAEAAVAGAKQNLPRAVHQVGGAAFQGGNLDEALAQFSKAAELAELYADVATLGNARKWIGNTVMKQGSNAFNAEEYETAAAIFKKGYDANPTDTEVGMNLARSYIGMGDYEKGNEIYIAIMDLEKVDERFVDAAQEARNSFSADNLAKASEAALAKDFEKAIAVIDTLLVTVPADAAAHMLRLQTYNNTKNYAKVVELGDSAVAAQLDEALRSSANYLVGVAYQNRENGAKALEYYRKVTEGNDVAAAKAQIAELQK